MKGFLILLALLCSAVGLAHPISVSYVNLWLGAEGMDATIEAQNVDLLHELPGLSAASLAAHQSEIAGYVISRFTVTGDGEALKPTVQGIKAIPDQQAVQLSLHYAWVHPLRSLHLESTLFSYHPQHQTLVDIYQGKALRSELVFDGKTTAQGYVTGSTQSTSAVFKTFLVQGINHIFTGPDHILFIVGLLLLGGSIGKLLKIVTAFTVAHSVTLCLAALGILNPPARIIEPCIALSIVFVGVHGMITLRRGGQVKWDPRLLFAFGFGFIHGFGFANALAELELPRQALATALFSFNLGVECGQACIVLAVAPLLELLRRRKAAVSRIVVVAGSWVVVAMGGFWFLQRVTGNG